MDNGKKPSKLDTRPARRQLFAPELTLKRVPPEPFVEGDEVTATGITRRRKMTVEQIAKEIGPEVAALGEAFLNSKKPVSAPREILPTYKHRDPEKRKVYMRELMRKKRAEDKKRKAKK